jgi:hypothetical protein
MRKQHAFRLAAIAIAAAGVLVGSALPAAAVPIHDYDTVYASGVITVDGNVTANFPTPSPPTGNCTGSTTIAGEIDEAGGTDTIDGVLSISTPFTAPSPFSGTYLLTVTGSSTGTNRGDWSGGTSGTFANLSFPGTTFNIKTLNPTTCVPGSQVCGSSANPSTGNGTLNLTASGGTTTGVTLPLGTGDTIFVIANGTFTNAGCTLFHPFNLIISTGATIALGDNPADCYLDPGTPTPPPPPAAQTCGVGSSADPGAIFTEV